MIPETVSTLDSIDFLPAQYREEGRKRRAHAWRAIVVVAFVAMFGVTAVYQRGVQRSVERELSEVARDYAAAKARSEHLKQLQAELLTLDQKADVLTYLRHPWPRTQILSALITPRPEVVRLEELRLQRQTVERVAPQTAAPPQPAAKEETLAPSVADLQRLVQEGACEQWAIHVSGTTGDMVRLHQYLADLDRDELFERVDLGGIEDSAQASGAAPRFSARLIVRPGYGQPEGPRPSEDKTSAAPASSSSVPPASKPPQHAAAWPIGGER